jgi:hypothetical protein
VKILVYHAEVLQILIAFLAFSLCICTKTRALLSVLRKIIMFLKFQFKCAPNVIILALRAEVYLMEIAYPAINLFIFSISRVFLNVPSNIIILKIFQLKRAINVMILA